MTTRITFDTNVSEERLLPSPRSLKESIPVSAHLEELVLSTRSSIRNILDGNDPRKFLIVGPCSIHDPRSAIEYAERLSHLSSKVNDQFLLVMRAYFEKPRTSTGWKGFLNDPHLNDSFQIEEGLQIGRKLLLDIGLKGVPVGTEALDPVVPQYLDDIISWYAIGARTTESQTHREMASGLSAPVGFKNGTDGGVTVAINALLSVSHPHHFLGINHEGQCAVIATRGNPHAHIVLRGGGQPNYDSVHISQYEKLLRDAKITPRLVVDCSHGNSMKEFSLQAVVFKDCINQIVDGNRSIVGLMLESHLKEGSQRIPADLSKLQYGVSVTDACIGWETTESVILDAAERLRTIR
jgi:3-deoxy-7-phosphoheptulonate synthase